MRQSCETQKGSFARKSRRHLSANLTCSARLYRSDLFYFAHPSPLSTADVLIIAIPSYQADLPWRILYNLNLRGTLQYDQYESTTKLLACAFFFFSSPLPCLAARRKIVCFVDQPMMDKPRGDPFLAQRTSQGLPRQGQDRRGTFSVAKEAVCPYLLPPHGVFRTCNREAS